MNARLHSAPLAVASDGSVLVNAVEFDGEVDMAAVMERAIKQSGTVFIGVAVTPAEQRALCEFLAPTLHEVVSLKVVGPRQPRRKTAP